MNKFGFTTTSLHSDRKGSEGRLGKPEHGSLHKPIHNSIAYGFESAKDLAAVFQGTGPGYGYARQANPTVEALEKKVTKMENGLDTVAFSTGMSAISSVMFSLLKEGDHVISSSFLFGNTNSYFNTLTRIGCLVSFVDPTDVLNVEEMIQPDTKMVFVETIANPVTQVPDLQKIGDLCEKRKIPFIVDNTMTSPFLFRAKDVKAAFSINSLSKYIGGHGNALGGTVTDTGYFDWAQFENILDMYKEKKAVSLGIFQLRKKGLRDIGGALSPDSAHLISAGSDTLALRMTQACKNAQALAEFFEKHSKIKRVNYPGLPSHPTHQFAKECFDGFGALMSFEVEDSIDCFAFLDKLEVIVLSSNLGDNRTLAIPVAHTIFYEMGPERRQSMDIGDNLIRLSVGIENTEDLISDFEQALNSF